MEAARNSKGLSMLGFVKKYEIPVSPGTFKKWLFKNLDKFDSDDILIFENGTSKKKTVKIMNLEKVRKCFFEGF